MSDSKKDDSWSFQIDPSDTKEKKKERKSVNPSSLLKKTSSKKKGKGLSLDYENKPDRISRSKLASQEAESNELANNLPSIELRLKAGFVDGLIYTGIYFVSNYINKHESNLLSSIISSIDLPAISKMMEVSEIRVATIYIMIMLLFYFIVPVISGKTIGKMFFNLIIDDKDGGRIGVFRTFLREIILKPLSLLTVIGLASMFFNKSRVTLHDLIIKSVVRKNYF